MVKKKINKKKLYNPSCSCRLKNKLITDFFLTIPTQTRKFDRARKVSQ